MSDIYESEDEYKKADYYDACDSDSLENDFEYEAILQWVYSTNLKHIFELRNKTCTITAYSLSDRNPRTVGKRILSGEDLEKRVAAILFNKHFGVGGIP